MGLFEIGSLHNLHFGDEDLTATIIYNDGEFAVAGNEVTLIGTAQVEQGGEKDGGPVTEFFT